MIQIKIIDFNELYLHVRSEAFTVNIQITVFWIMPCSDVEE